MNNRLYTKKIIQKWKIIFFIIIAPVSLSYGGLNDISFGVIHYPRVFENYLFTVPVSLFILIPFIFSYLFNLYKNKEIIFLLFLFFINFLSNTILNYQTHMDLLLKIFAPILLLIGLEIYFKNFFRNFDKKKYFRSY